MVERTAIKLVDPAGDEIAVGQEHVHPIGGADIPVADVVQNRAGEDSISCRFVQARLLQILMLQIPGEPHR